MLEPGRTYARYCSSDIRLQNTPVIYRVAADFVVVIHFCFAAFVVFGALLALRWRWVSVIHIPAALWGAIIEFFGIICPLTPLEQQLRHLAGENGYTGGFIEHYLLPILYPAGLSRTVQFVLGALVVLINFALYAWLVLRRGRAHADFA